MAYENGHGPRTQVSKAIRIVSEPLLSVEPNYLLSEENITELIMIPFYDLTSLNRKYLDGFIESAKRVVESGIHKNGQETHDFYRSYADDWGTKKLLV